MEPQFLSIHYSDSLWIAIALVCGLGARVLGLPPLVGFLEAGFLLASLGAEGSELLDAMADMGITLLLFSIGLKLKLKSLAKPEVWGVASVHMLLVTVLFTAMVLVVSLTSMPLLSGLDIHSALLIGFAMSFSSTVFAVKVLDDLGATGARHGQVAIGVLVVQDIAAVVFIAVSLGKLPTPWVLGLVALIPARYLLFRILDRVGHGELLILFGITLALAGADIFELVGIKKDVGALVFGMLLANHSKANELAKALFGFKELFLVGFFLSIGMTAVPGWDELLVALLFIMFLPLKVMLYFGLFNLYNLRCSTSWRTSVNLANFSEFGLIVGAIAVSGGWLQKEWLAVFAVVMTLSFILSSVLVNIRDNLFQQWHPWLTRFERPVRLPGEENLDLAHIRMIVFGMGRMGSAVYNAMAEEYHETLVGVEIDRDKAAEHVLAGRNVICADASNPDFWTRALQLLDGLEWVLLTLPTHKANMNAAILLREMGYTGRIAATTKYLDEEKALKEVGVEHTFNIYTEAGLGFADLIQAFIEKKQRQEAAV